MELTKLGWNAALNQQFAPHHAKGLVSARVAVEDKHFFRVWTADAELLAQVSGKCIHEARRSNSKLPKVGDWVAVKLVPNEEKAVIPTRRSKGCNNLLGRGVGVKSNKPSETRMRRLQHGRGCNSTLWLVDARKFTFQGMVVC
jgi:hypothetical protein